MKKTLAIVLALAMALSMFASMAFVLNPGAGTAVTAPTANALQITDFFVTDDAAMKAGAAVYTDLVDNTDGALYIAKNEIIRLALTFDVLNPNVISNAVKAIGNPDVYPVEFTSKTVDLSLSKYAGMQALRVPFAVSGNLINAVNTIPNKDGLGAQYDALLNKLSLNINVYNTTSGLYGNIIAAGSVDVDPNFGSDAKPVAKRSFAYLFTGLTKGEITEKGSVVANIGGIQGADNFDDGYVVKTVNGRNYIIVKTNAVGHAPVTDLSLSAGYYKLGVVGYKVYSVALNATTKAWEATPIAQFDTESVTYLDPNFGILVGKEVEGIGQSLGLETLQAVLQTWDSATYKTVDAVAQSLQAKAFCAADKLAFKTVLNDGTVRYVTTDQGKPAFDAAQMANFNTALADLGLSTDINYTYKITDGLFTAEGAFASTLVAEYNNGVVAPIEAEDEADVQEGTEDVEIGEVEEGDIVEDEEIPDEDIIEDVEVPTTGDATASIVLAAAAIMAAAALAFVMKKVRD